MIQSNLFILRHRKNVSIIRSKRNRRRNSTQSGIASKRHRYFYKYHSFPTYSVLSTRGN